jgi:hypothetical protein
MEEDWTREKRIIIVPTGLCFRLRSITQDDLENLRVWKNRHSERFFFRQQITPQMQRQWYEGFRVRPYDYMFMIEATCQSAPDPFGCVGFRLLGEVIDLYNLIRGKTIEGQKCTMGQAFDLAMSYALRFEKPVEGKVLKGNPQIGFFESHKLRRFEEHPDHYLIRLDTEAFIPIPYSVSELP